MAKEIKEIDSFREYMNTPYDYAADVAHFDEIYKDARSQGFNSICAICDHMFDGFGLPCPNACLCKKLCYSFKPISDSKASDKFTKKWNKEFGFLDKIKALDLQLSLRF